MLETIAKTKWCPQTPRVYIKTGLQPSCMCMGQACMLWKWAPKVTDTDETEKTEGVCGLIK